ncbi:MAG: DUF4421 family protein [Bacteroidaceae bacterium]|nr:DUF4421 family protein [Bacteroidaceae bacterium]
MLLAVLCLQPVMVMAGDGVTRFIRSIDRWLEDGQRAGIDTNYIAVPRLNHQIYMGTYRYWQNYKMYMPFYVENAAALVPGLRDNDSYRINAHTNEGEFDIGIDWKGFAVEFPFSAFSNYLASFGLAKTGNVWGFRLRYKYLKQMDGSSNVGSEKLEDQNNALRILYGEGYYVLNSRRFSLAAGLYADMVQKHSAGSMLLYVNFYQSRYNVTQLLPDNYDSFRTQQVSIGAGYAYNYSLLRGRLLFHGSLVPMFSVWNHLRHDAGINADLTPDQWKQLDNFYEAANSGHARFRINAFARFAANYSWRDYALSVFLNYRHYGYSNSRSLDILNRELDCQINVIHRF